MPQFETASFISQIFWLFLTFGLLYLGIRNFFVPKMSSILESRDFQITSMFSKAELAKNEAEDIDKKIKERLEQARIKSKNMISDTSDKINKMRASKDAQFEVEVKKMFDNSDNLVNEFKQQAAKEIENISLSAAKFALKEFVNLSISDKDLQSRISNAFKASSE